MMETTKELLVAKGIKEANISAVFRDMFAFHRKLDALQGKIQRYKNCSLRSSTNPAIIGAGSYNPEIMVITDYPNESEVKQGHIGFADYSMYLLLLLQRLGIDNQDIYWTSAIKYHTSKVNMTYIKECLPLLKEEIQVLDPSVIITLGNTPTSALAGQPLKVEEVKGSLKYEISPAFEDIPVFAIKHPKSILDLEKEEFQEKTKDAWKILKEIGNYM